MEKSIYLFMIRKFIVLLLLIVFISAINHSSEAKVLRDSSMDLTNDWLAQIKWKNGYLNCNISLQLWNVVSLDYNNLELDPRYDLYLRRGRLGFGGKLANRLSFGTTFSYDGAGKNQFTQSQGVLNNDERFQAILRDGFLSYSFSPLFNLTMGFFRPRVGKESFYSSWFCISQEKSLPNIQVRRHLVGRLLGRESGLNLGGIHQFSEKFGVGYDLGFFDLNHPLVAGDDSTGNLLKAGRVFLMLGDPEVKNYSLIYYQSGFGNRKGVTLGLNASHQGSNSIFDYNMVLGADVQVNWGPLDVVLEYDWLLRDNKSLLGEPGKNTVDQVNSAKLAWNFKLKNNTLLQPTILFTSEIADDEGAGVNEFTKSMDQQIVAFGVNWLINKDKLKLGLHFTDGKISSQDNYRFVNASVQFML